MSAGIQKNCYVWSSDEDRQVLVYHDATVTVEGGTQSGCIPLATRQRWEQGYRPPGNRRLCRRCRGLREKARTPLPDWMVRGWPSALRHIDTGHLVVFESVALRWDIAYVDNIDDGAPLWEMWQPQGGRDYIIFRTAGGAG